MLQHPRFYCLSSLVAITLLFLFYSSREQSDELLLEDVDAKNVSFIRGKEDKTLGSSLIFQNASKPRAQDLIALSIIPLNTSDTINASESRNNLGGSGLLDHEKDVPPRTAGGIVGATAWQPAGTAQLQNVSSTSNAPDNSSDHVEDASQYHGNVASPHATNVKSTPPACGDTRTLQHEDATPCGEVDSNMTGIPFWSKLPRSQFTDHVLDNIQRLKLDADQECDDPIDFIVETPYSIPNITCDPSHQWCKTMQRIFKSQTIPYNVSVGFLLGDFFEEEQVDQGGCFGNSSPKGVLCMPNMEDLRSMVQGERFRGTDRYKRGYHDKPWEERQSLPVFRGSAWVAEQPSFDMCLYGANLTYPMIMRDFPSRFRTVDFSVDHPDLLDARFSAFDKELENNCMKKNATNGLNKLLPADFIDYKKYFENYQVALALPGIGAAFRVSIHFMTRTAVMLQEESEFEEWFTSYLEPFVHYIPLSRDLHDLEERLIWVKTHWEEIKRIAENGQAFYEKYLTFDRHEEHIHELVYRLSEYIHFRETQRRPETR